MILDLRSQFSVASSGVFCYNNSMTITWYGHSCFRIEGKNISLIIDPFSKEIGLRPPRLAKDNIVLISHNHFDHNNTEGVQDGAMVISGPGEYEKSGVQVEGISSYHDNQNGKERGLNTIYIIRTEGITLCHLGDLGQDELSHEQSEAIGNIDILFIPVGGKYTIDAKTASEIVKEIDPKIIIPMHYKIEGLNVDIDTHQNFLKEVGIKSEDVGSSWKVNEKSLPVDETKLIVFKI